MAGKAADGLIGFQKFGMVVCDGFFIRDGVIVVPKDGVIPPGTVV